MHEGATPRRVGARRIRDLRCGRVVAGAGPREKSDENTTCATERFAQVDIPSDSVPSVLYRSIFRPDSRLRCAAIRGSRFLRQLRPSWDLSTYKK